MIDIIDVIKEKFDNVELLCHMKEIPLLKIETDKLLEIITFIKTQDYNLLLDIVGMDNSTFVDKQDERYSIIYHFRHKEFKEVLSIKVDILDEKDGVESLTSLFKVANWLEREVFDQYGINFKNHPLLKRVLNHHEFVGHPLRKDYEITKGQYCTYTPDMMDELEPLLKERDLDIKKDNLMVINLGPSHPASHGTIRTLCALDGEKIKAAATEIGYLHRGFEKSCENHTYNQIIPYTDRLNYCSAIMNNVAFSKTVEDMLGITIPDRGVFIRVIVSELSRIIDHLVCLSAGLLDMGAQTNYWYLFNPRGEAYDFLSKLTGARLTNSYTRVGGITHDFYEGWEADLDTIIKSIEKGIDQTLIMVERNRIFHDRVQDVSPVSAEQAISFGFTGPNLRASGVAYDLRFDKPYDYYDTFDFDLVAGSHGDTHDRYMVRFYEIAESIKIIRQAVKRLPDGPISIDNPSIILPTKDKVYGSIEGVMNQFKLVYEGVKVPKQTYYGAYEAANGELGFTIKSDGTGTPYRVKVRAPSFVHIQTLPQIIEGSQVGDAVLTLGSLNIIAGEMDR